MKGELYIVSTPIGNLEDITLRALRVLKEVDLIAAEDTRHSLKLLNHYGISKPIVSYWGEKERLKAEEILKKLNDGRSVALISDAGTPGISDPGAVLIRRAIEENIRVVPVPGPTALISALSIAGLASEEFTYCGFLPVKRNQRRKVLEELSLEKRTLIIYEAPHRVHEFLHDLADIFGERRAVLVREITKIHEEAVRGSISGILAGLNESRVLGECVIVVEGKKGDAAAPNIQDALAEIRSLMKKGLGRKEAVKKIAGAYGLSRNELYDKSLGDE